MEKQNGVRSLDEILTEFRDKHSLSDYFFTQREVDYIISNKYLISESDIRKHISTAIKSVSFINCSSDHDRYKFINDMMESLYYYKDENGKSYSTNIKDFIVPSLKDQLQVLASGAKQNKVNHTYTNLFPDSMLLGASQTRYDGVEKYGKYNHLKIDPKENIDRAINHLMSYINKDTRQEEDHLSHAVVRIGMAMDFIKNFGYTTYDKVKEEVDKFIENNGHDL